MATRDLTRSTGPRSVMPLSEAMNQLFRDAFTSPFGGAAPGLTASQAVNLYEQDNRFIVQVPLPGAKPDQLNITARENVVTLQGTIEPPAPEGARPLYQGLGGGPFREQVVLPADVDAENASAQYQDGILTLTLPKAQHAQERTIRISQGQSRSGADGQDQARHRGGPGHGTGPRDEVGHTGVYPVSAMDEASPDAPIKGQMEWGQGERGAAGYEDHGESEVITIPPEGEDTGAG